MEKIRVTPKMVTIEVSDNGETIKFCADELLMVQKGFSWKCSDITS